MPIEGWVLIGFFVFEALALAGIEVYCRYEKNRLLKRGRNKHEQ